MASECVCFAVLLLLLLVLVLVLLLALLLMLTFTPHRCVCFDVCEDEASRDCACVVAVCDQVRIQ